MEKGQKVLYYGKVSVIAFINGEKIFIELSEDNSLSGWPRSSAKELDSWVPMLKDRYWSVHKSNLTPYNPEPCINNNYSIF